MKRKDNKTTTMRLTPYARKIIGRYCRIHGWSLVEFNERLAQLLDSGLEMLGNEKIRASTLQEYYGNSALVVVADQTEFFKPTYRIVLTYMPNFLIK